MSYRIALLAAAGTMALGAASAQDKEGYYGALGGSYAWEYGRNDFQSDAASGEPDLQQFDSRLEMGDGFGLYGAFGKHFPRGLRGEFELSFRTQNVEEMPGDGLGFAGFPTGANGQNVVTGEAGVRSLGDNRDLGNFNVTTGMVNVYKDFNLDIAGRLTPYVGAGIGFANVRADFDNVDDQRAATTADFGAGRPVGYRILASNDDYVTAVQGLAGVSMALAENLSLDVGYRYLRTGEYDFEAFVNNVPTEVTGEYSVHETTVGLRWDFGAGAAPAPRPVPVVRETEPETKTCFDGTVVPIGQPCPVAAADEGLTPAELRTVVYFDLNSATLTPAARTLLQRRAAEAADLDLVEVLVSGNTDTSGSASYNERLSSQRAAVVREALIGFGIDADLIRVRALGESNLAKPTADGVKEPLNRRTEIDFDF